MDEIDRVVIPDASTLAPKIVRTRARVDNGEFQSAHVMKIIRNYIDTGEARELTLNVSGCTEGFITKVQDKFVNSGYEVTRDVDSQGNASHLVHINPEIALKK